MIDYIREQASHLIANVRYPKTGVCEIELSNGAIYTESVKQLPQKSYTDKEYNATAYELAFAGVCANWACGLLQPKGFDGKEATNE